MSAFYNENDPKAAAWLRELIAFGLIASGVVDERSITEIKPYELEPYTQCHFFAGIGGWSHALRLAGVSDESPVWTGSCPCQPLSCAGQRKGHADERHLWPAFYRLIAECAPAIVFGEQVASPDGLEWFAGIRADLEAAGYAVGGADLCAAGVGAPHPRQRIYWMADSQGSEYERARRTRAGRSRPSNGHTNVRLGDANGAGSQQGRQTTTTNGHGHSTQPAGGSCGLDDAECIEEHATAAQRLHAMPCGTGGMGNAHDPASARYGRDSRKVLPEQESEGLGGSGSLRNFWDSFDLCSFTGADAGKTRRVEPGTFPLAHGVSERMGLLRGYGNAIVPQVAARFIQAALSA